MSFLEGVGFEFLVIGLLVLLGGDRSRIAAAVLVPCSGHGVLRPCGGLGGDPVVELGCGKPMGLKVAKMKMLVQRLEGKTSARRLRATTGGVSCARVTTKLAEAGVVGGGRQICFARDLCVIPCWLQEVPFGFLILRGGDWVAWCRSLLPDPAGCG